MRLTDRSFDDDPIPPAEPVAEQSAEEMRASATDHAARARDDARDDARGAPIPLALTIRFLLHLDAPLWRPAH